MITVCGYISDPEVVLSLMIPNMCGSEGAVDQSVSVELSEEEQSLNEECMELFNHFNHKCLEAILRATKLSLDLVRKRVFFQGSVTKLVVKHNSK